MYIYLYGFRATFLCRIHYRKRYESSKIIPILFYKIIKSFCKDVSNCRDKVKIIYNLFI